MDRYNQAAKRVAIEFASAIGEYCVERDRNAPSGFVSAAELAEAVKQHIERIHQGIFSKQDILVERIAGMMCVVEAIGGTDYAHEICSLLEAMDDKETENGCDKRHFYAANFDHLASDYIKDWLS